MPPKKDAAPAPPAEESDPASLMAKAVHVTFRASAGERAGRLESHRAAQEARELARAEAQAKGEEAGDAEEEAQADLVWAVRYALFPAVEADAEVVAPEAAPVPPPGGLPPPEPEEGADPEEPPPPQPAFLDVAHVHEVTADEAFVRQMVGTQEAHALNNTRPCQLRVTVIKLPATADPAAPPPADQPPYPTCELVLDATPLLLGETDVAVTFKREPFVPEAEDDDRLPAPPRYTPALPEDVFAECEAVTLSLSVTSIPEPEPEPPANPEEPMPPMPPPPGPVELMTPALAAHLNPLVVRPLAVRNLPDLPATTEQLDNFCAPVSIAYALPLAPAASAAGYVPECRHVATVTTPWVGDEGPDEARTRDVLFGTADVYFACDLDTHALYEGLRNTRLTVEVHDRSKQEDPPVDLSWSTGGILPRQEGEEFEEEAAAEEEAKPAEEDKPAEEGEGGEEGAAEDVEEDEEDEGDPAYARADFALTELVTRKLPGVHRLVMRQALAPYTTVKGGLSVGQSFEWYSRPGRYGQCRSTVQLEIASAQPIVKSEVNRPYERVAFVMQYDDTELLLALEGLVRVRNATTMGFEGTESYILQLLNTYKTGEEEARNDQLDILTGFHLIDGKVRIVVLEGLGASAIRVPRPPPTLEEGEAGAEGAAKGENEEGEPEEEQFDLVDGAMTDVYAIAREFVTRTDKRRHILMNPRIQYAERLYVPLGLDLQRLKLRYSLNRICANAHVFAGGMVRKLVLESLKKIQKLRDVRFLRQVDRLNLLPTSEMLVYLYKKFGGAMTKDDIFGVPLPVPEDEEEEDEEEAEEEEAEAAAIAAAAAADAPPPPPRPKRKSKKGTQSIASLMQNPVYMAERERRTKLRAERDFEYENIDAIDALEAATVPEIKTKWQEWNPVRRHLGAQALARYGVDLEAAEARAEAEAEAERAAAAFVPPSTFPHPKPFHWPEAKELHMYKVHPKRPTDMRIEELQEAWHENENHGGNAARDDRAPAGKKEFLTIMPAPDLFGKDPEYWKTVFISGDGLAAEQKADKEAAIAEWKSKLVVADTVVHHPTKRWHSNQIDRYGAILQAGPRADPSMFIGVEFKDNELTEVLKRRERPNNWLTEMGFYRHIARDKSQAAINGWHQSWSNETGRRRK